MAGVWDMDCKIALLDMGNSKCISDLPVKMFCRQLLILVWNSRKRLVRSRDILFGNICIQIFRATRLDEIAKREFIYKEEALGYIFLRKDSSK